MKKFIFTLFALVLASGIAAQIPEPDSLAKYWRFIRTARLKNWKNTMSKCAPEPECI